MRVGRLVIYGDSTIPLKSLQMQQATLHRMLIAVLSFLCFLKLIANKNIRIPRVSVAIIASLVWLRYCLCSNKVLSNILCSKYPRHAHNN